MKNKVETPIYLVTADIYLRFPEIMEEEYRDLLGYLDYEHILYERCTGEVTELQQKVNQLESTLNEVRKVVSKSVFKTDLVELCGMKNEIKEILDKVGGSNE